VRHLILGTVLALLPLAAAAQTAPAFSVTVTERTELVEEIGTTRRIGREDIEARNARTLDEALRLLPGVHVRTGGDGTPRIDIRGFRSRHVLLLINGVQVNSTTDGQFDPARISTDAIREIKVSYGSSSVLYGDNALAGVIEITTIDDTLDATASISGGTADQKGVGGRYARTAGDWSVMLAGTGYDTAGYQLSDDFTPTSLEDGGRRENSDRNRADFRGAVGYRVSPAVSIGSEWFISTGSYGIPPGIVGDTTDIFAQTPRFERVEDYRTGSGQVSIVAAPSSRFTIRGWVYRNTQREDRSRYDDATYTSMDDPLVPNTFQSRERSTVTGSSALGRVDLQRYGSLRLAINQRREAFESDGVVRDVPITPSGGSGGGGGGRGGGGGGSQPPQYDVRSVVIGDHVDVYSAGAEWEVRPLKKLGAVLGAALNHQDRPDGLSDTAPTWLAGLTYDATTAWRLHTSASRRIRVPSIDQLFNTSSGNPALRSEHTYGVEVGAEYRLTAASSVAVAGFATDAHDFIERQSGQPFQNQDQYQFRGAEVSAATSWIPRVTLRGAYSFLDSEDVTTGRMLQTRPRHRTSLDGTWKPWPSSVVRSAVSYTGTQLYDARGTTPVQMQADPYALVDLGFTQTLATRFDVGFDVTNLFDELYDQSYGLPREGRAAVLTLRFRAR
jgi:outer membrane cobalamin receptor